MPKALRLIELAFRFARFARSFEHAKRQLLRYLDLRRRAHAQQSTRSRWISASRAFSDI
jgi:hypothetical protein